jgi:putative SOS response-associated peptidase YedK
MCFHTEQTKLGIELEKRFKATLDNPIEFRPQNHINGFEFPQTPVIIDEDPQIITHYTWGLIPAWAKDEEIQKYTLNAKIETVSEKLSFKNSVNKRCLVIANGYFEWQWLDPKGTKKQKYELCLPNDELFAFAGLYSHWVDKNTGEIKNTYTLLTTEASLLLAEIHNNKKRMPVVLKHEDETKWLQHEPIEHFAYPYNVDLIANKIA